MVLVRSSGDHWLANLNPLSLWFTIHTQEQGKLSFADCAIVTFALRKDGIVATFDKGISDVPGVRVLSNW